MAELQFYYIPISEVTTNIQMRALPLDKPITGRHRNVNLCAVTVLLLFACITS